jgi:hypothetical protein
MDAAMPNANRAESALHVVTPSSEPQRALKVRAEYRLDEAGRKASLLQGGNGQAHQRVVLTLPATRLHLVHVAKDGTAHLKLRPQFRLNDEQRIVLIDARPSFDHVPTTDELLQEAARNHELERGFFGQKTTSRATRREAFGQWLEQTAREFLADQTRRAIAHPAPTARVCQLATSRGPIHVFANSGSTIVRQVPLEAFRRFQNDQRIRHGQASIQREHDMAVDAERRQLMAEWVAEYGTPDQRDRFAAGALPKAEWLAAVTAATFAPLAAMPTYDSNGARTLQDFLRQVPAHASVVVTYADYRVVTKPLTTAAPTQWEWMQWARRLLPSANVHLRERELVWNGDTHAPRHHTITLLVTTKVGPLNLRREFTVPEAAPAATERTKEELFATA